MGACVSVHKGSQGGGGGGGGMKLDYDNLVMPESPVKDKQQLATSDHAHQIMTFDQFGSKEEAFFDSQPWLESDCEDDFFSVNGDFTPSRGNTPVHHSFSIGTPKINRIPLENRPPTPSSVPEPSPTGKKKRLAELFSESASEDQDGNEVPASSNQTAANGKTDAKPTVLDILPKSGTGTPYISGANSVCSSERTPNEDALIEREKPFKSMQCCLPSLISSRSFKERKTKMSPAVAVSGQA